VPLLSDNAANTWVHAATFRDPTQTVVQHLFYALDADPITSVTSVVHAADGTSPPLAAHFVVLQEFKGLKGFIDAASVLTPNVQPGATTTGPSITVSGPALVIDSAAAGVTNRNLAVSSGWTEILPLASMAQMRNWRAYREVIAPGDYAATWTLSGTSGASVSQIAAAFTLDPDYGGALTVSVGEDRAALAGQTVTLGVEAGGGSGTRNYSWSITSGPSGGEFSSTNSATTTFNTGGVVGTYVLRCTVTDSTGTAFDELTLTVNPRPRVDITAASGWTNVVGAATALAALTDNDPASFVETGPNPASEVLTLTVPPIEVPDEYFVWPLDLSVDGPGGWVVPEIRAGETWVAADPIYVSSATATYYEVEWPVTALAGVTWNDGFQVRLVASVDDVL